jgi:hypothetical protein
MPPAKSQRNSATEAIVMLVRLIIRGSQLRKRGERFVYLTWGTVEQNRFTMFRRAKLMLDELPAADEVTVDVTLTDEDGMPRCARLRPPATSIR